MELIIAEKPDIAKAVSKVLPGAAAWKNGFIAQGDYCITWCYGHLLTLKDPEDYGEEYSRENTPNDKLPIFFKDWEMKVADKGPALLKNGKNAPNKAEQVKVIGNLLHITLINEGRAKDLKNYRKVKRFAKAYQNKVSE